MLDKAKICDLKPVSNVENITLCGLLLKNGDGL